MEDALSPLAALRKSITRSSAILENKKKSQHIRKINNERPQIIKLNEQMSTQIEAYTAHHLRSRAISNDQTHVMNCNNDE
jgi:hypothetical protein